MMLLMWIIHEMNLGCLYLRARNELYKTITSYVQDVSLWTDKTWNYSGNFFKDSRLKKKKKTKKRDQTTKQSREQKEI